VPFVGILELVLIMELPLDGLGVSTLVSELGVMVEMRVEVEVIVVVDTSGVDIPVSELVVMVESQVVVEVIVVVESPGGDMLDSEDIGKKDEVESMGGVLLE